MVSEDAVFMVQTNIAYFFPSAKADYGMAHLILSMVREVFIGVESKNLKTDLMADL